MRSVSNPRRRPDSRPLEKKPGISLKDLLQNVAMGNTQEEILSSLANRLIRLDKQINEKERMGFAEKSGGFMINHVVKNLLNAYDPDSLERIELKVNESLKGQSLTIIEETIKKEKQKLIDQAVDVFNNQICVIISSMCEENMIRSSTPSIQIRS
jgi:type I restriction enzyme R subunit